MAEKNGYNSGEDNNGQGYDAYNYAQGNYNNAPGPDGYNNAQGFEGGNYAQGNYNNAPGMDGGNYTQGTENYNNAQGPEGYNYTQGSDNYNNYQGPDYNYAPGPDGYNYAQGPEVPEPKRNNKKLGIIIGSIIGAVAVIAIICAVLLPKLLVNDKTRVCRALGEVGTDMISGNPASVFSNIGAGEMFAKFKEESMEGKLSLELDEFTGTTYGFMPATLEGFQIDLDMASDMKEKQMTGNMTLGYLDMELFTAGIYADEESFSFGIPALFDGYLRLPSENIVSAYNQSVLGKDDPVDDSMDFSLNMFADVENNEDMIQVGAKLGSDAIVLYNNMTVEKMASDRQFNLDGKSQTAKKYVMTIKHEDYYNLVNNYLDGIMGSEKLMASVGLNAQQIKFYQDGFNRMFNGDIQVDVYLAGDKVACIEAFVKLDSPYESESSDDQVDATLSVSFADSAAYNQAYTGKITLDNDGDSISMTLNKDTIIDGEKASSEFALYMDVDGSFLDYTYAASYDKRSGGYSYDIDLMVDNDTFSVGMNGTVNSIKEGTSFDFTIDDLFMDGEGERLGMSGSIAAGPLDGSVKKPDVDFRDLFSMTEDEYMDFMLEVQENIYGTMYE